MEKYEEWIPNQSISHWGLFHVVGPVEVKKVYDLEYYYHETYHESAQFGCVYCFDLHM